MYYRPQGSQQRNLSIPPNYGGNAFYDRSEKLTDKEPQSFSEEQEELKIPESSVLEKAQSSLDAEPAAEAGLFKKDSFLGKIGSEERLLLAIIFLISDSGGGDDILWLLVLLLFIK